jgi:homocysteine S-methyltransferase
MDIERRFRGGLVLDGGLATELERRGADLHDELWSARVLLEDPDLIRQTHVAYFEAGAEVAITASYQASFEGFARRGLDREDASRLLRLSVTLARDAAEEVGGQRIVAASIGPYGAALADGSEYAGRYGLTVQQLIAFHRPRLETLLAAEPDVLAVETVPSLEEAEAIVRLLDDYPGSKAWLSFSCRDGNRISDGTPFAAAAMVAASSPSIVAIGVNCSPPGYVEELLRADMGGLPALAYPNLGSTWDPEAKVWRASGPRPDFAALAPRWRDAGASVIGGCCGTTPQDIAAIVAVLR